MATAPHGPFFHFSTPTPQKMRRGRLQPRQTSPFCKLTTGELAPPTHRLSDPGAHAWQGNADQGEQVKCPHLPQPQLHCQASPLPMWVRYREPDSACPGLQQQLLSALCWKIGSNTSLETNTARESGLTSPAQTDQRVLHQVAKVQPTVAI